MDIIWVGMAFLLGFTASKAKIPPLVGYLAAGLVLSFTTYDGGPLLDEIAHLGVIFLLFTVGLHINLKNILSIIVLGVGLTHLTISTLIFSGIAVYFGFDLSAALIIGVTLGFSSTVLTAKTLESRGELGSYYGRIAIGILIIQDIVAIGIIAVTGGGVPSVWAPLLLALPLLRPLILSVVEWIKEDELIIILSLTLALAGASLFELVEVSGELGALAMGMMLPTDDRKIEILERNLWSIKESFLVGFFLSIGLGGFPSFEELGFVIVVLAILPIKGIMFYLLFMAFKLKARTGFMSAVTLTAYSEFTLIAGVVAAQNGYIPDSAVIILGLITAISYMLNAPLTAIEDKIYNRFNKLLLYFERETQHPEKKPSSFGAAEYIVVGMGSGGKAAYDELVSKGKKVVGIDVDPGNISINLKEGRRVVYEDLQDLSTSQHLDFSKIRDVILTTKKLSSKLMIISNLRKMEFSNPIYVLTSKESEAKYIQEAGGIAMSIPIKEAGRKVAQLCISSENKVGSIKFEIRKPRDNKENQ